jgi:hypothetical protein
MAEVSDPDTSTSTDNDPSTARKPPIPVGHGWEYMSVRERLTKEMDKTASGQQPGFPMC